MPKSSNFIPKYVLLLKNKSFECILIKGRIFTIANTIVSLRKEQIEVEIDKKYQEFIRGQLFKRLRFFFKGCAFRSLRL